MACINKFQPGNPQKKISSGLKVLIIHIILPSQLITSARQEMVYDAVMKMVLLVTEKKRECLDKSVQSLLWI